MRLSQMSSRLLLLLGILVLAAVPEFVTAAKAKGKKSSSKSSDSDWIDPMKHDIFIVKPQTFDGLVGKFRNDHVSAIFYYTKEKPETRDMINGWFNDVAKDLKGMAKIGATDCDEFAKFCKDQGAEATPTIKVYPPNPMPTMDYKGTMASKDLRQYVLRFVPSHHVKGISKDNVDNFLSTQLGVPKVLLFSNKKKAPVLFNALSNAFYDRMNFGFVTDGEEALLTRFKVKKVPSLIVTKGDGKQPDVYKGEMKFELLHDFLNVRGETFVKGGGFSADAPEGAEVPKPWLSQKIPEMTTHSYRDICTNPPSSSRALCAIYLREGPLEEKEREILEKLSDAFGAASGDRGASFRWMWMDLAIEKNYKEIFERSRDSLPSLTIFNPHKRLRFTTLDSSKKATEDNIRELLDKILGGDARFRNIKGQKMPPFAERDLEGKPIIKKTKEEL